MIKSIVVPISGEQQNNEALSLALKIADETKTPVTLVHVEKSEQICSWTPSGIESVGEQIYHEYTHHLDKIVTECSPYSSLKERKQVTHIEHLSGKSGKEPQAISNFLKKSPRGLLVLEWKGVLVEGHASIIKELVKTTVSPILIVKMAPQAKSKLKFGREFKAA